MRCSLLRFAILLTTLLLPLQATALQPSSGDRVAGRVVSSLDQHPLSNASVTLRESKSNRSMPSITTDQDGRFSFDSVAPGKYALTATVTGYLSSSYQQHEQFWTAIVTGAGLATDSLVLQLTPMSSISGRIIDDAGDGLQHCSVILFRETVTASPERVTRFRFAQTSDDGEFELDKLPPGRYFLSATATPWYAIHPLPDPKDGNMPYRASVDPALDVAYPQIFYPHALDSSDASPIDLHGGEAVLANMQMQAQPAMSITLRLQPGEKPGQRSPQLIHSVFGSDESVPMQMDFVNGVQRITGIPPGQYNLREFASGSSIPNGSTPVDLISGSTSVDLAAPSHLATISVELHMTPDTSLPPNMRLKMQGIGENSSASAIVSDKKTSVLPNVPSGDYSFTLSGDSRPWVILGVAVSGQAAQNKTVHIADGRPVTVDITASDKTVAVQGFVRNDGKPSAGSMVVLVPATATPAEDLFRRDQSNLDGSFTLANVAPGNYILVAIDNGWSLRWNDGVELAPYLMHGTPIAISLTSPSVLQATVMAQPR